jgi:hypothetical protein
MRRADVLMVGPDGVRLLRCARDQVATLWAGPNGAQAPGAVGEVLRTLAPGPVWLLLDVVEEEYLTASLPAMRPRDRARLLERRLASAFGSTPLRLAQPATGTPPASSLLSAITRPELLTPWLEVLRESPSALAGVYSLALLGPAVLSLIGPTAGPCVLVSRQGVGGLRQSFLRDGQLVMSRLVPLGAAQDTLDGARVETELARLRQYLERSGLCAPDETPAVVVLTAEGRHAASANEAAQAWRYVAVDALLGARGPRQIDDCDALFAALLCRAPPATQYASPAQTAVHRGRRRTRLALSAMALGLCLAAGAGLWQTLEGLQLAARAAALAARNGETQASLIISRAAVPPVLMPSAQLRPAVALVAEVASRRSNPQPAIARAEAALATVSALRWTALEWQAAEAASPADVGQTLIRGTVEGLGGDERAALGAISALASALAGQPAVAGVKILETPLDSPASPGPAVPPSPGFAVSFTLGSRHAP